MSAEFIHMNHSIPDARAVVLRTPFGTVVHSGDWRVDHNPMVERSLDISALARLGDEGVRCLLADSTNVEQEGVPISETEAVRGIGRVLREAKRRVLVTMFSSNVHRLQGVLNEAHAQGRRVLLWGRSLHTVMGIARELGELKLPSDDIFLDSPEEAAALAPHRLLIVATGSQGEAQAALARIIRGDIRSISLDEGDCVVFSARVVPGNERVVSDLVNELHRRGVDVVTARDAPIHTTGHAHREDMRWLLRLLRPKVFVPIHGTPRMLTKHAKLAKDLSIPQVEVLYNGDVLELDDADAWRGDPVHAGKILIDASAGCPVAEERLRQRRNLAFGGVVLATMAVDPNACDICSGPSFKLNGVVFPGDTEEVLEEARQYVLEQFESVPDAQLKDLAAVDDFLRQAVRRYFRRAFQIKPVVMTLVLPVVR
jgi:ribonuclease J